MEDRPTTLFTVMLTDREDTFVREEAARLGIDTEAVLTALVWDEVLERERRHGPVVGVHPRPQPAVAAPADNAHAERLVRAAIRRRRRGSGPEPRPRAGYGMGFQS
jgi:hypothetical protein